jgi:hypothetical protein
MAPPGLDLDDRKRLEATIDAMVRSAPWREALNRYRWIDRYLSGEAFARYLEAEETRVRGILREFGTAAPETRKLGSAGPYPVVVLAGLLILGSLAVVHVRTHPVTAESHEPVRWAPVGWLAAGMVAYLLLVERGGFVVASAVLFWSTARAFNSQRPYRDAAFSVVVSVGAFLVFARLLQLSLPAGILDGLI